MATTLSNLTATQTQLQASYRLITAETSLSLVNFLPATHNSLFRSFFVNFLPASSIDSQKAGRQPDPKVRHHGPRISQHQHGRDGRAPIPGSNPVTAGGHPEADIDRLSRRQFTDDGAAYAIAQSIRSTVGALTSANQQLGTVTGLLDHAVRPEQHLQHHGQHARCAGQAVGQQRSGQERTNYTSSNTVDAGERGELI